jgi:hypothetical protein
MQKNAARSGKMLFMRIGSNFW